MILRSFIPPPLDLSLPFKNPPLPHSNRPDLLLRRHRKRRRRRTAAVVQTLASAFPLDLIAPALGFASGAALYLSYSYSSRRRRRSSDDPVTDAAVVGDWILFTSPTPFNRCVLLRCPSVSFEDGGELLDGVNERLVTEERHYVNLSRGRILARGGADGGEISYQRVCVRTEDGGVISLDWPDNLDMGKENGLDTTVLIVPGNAEGSMDRNVRMFVYDVLVHGCFPIVMNPRGCAGSPLTTARLFTAADSDDICTAIQFVNSFRPWTTLMSVGWGYGANMLTKYLVEVGDTTPLTAAVCIDNPFDLAEATRSFTNHTVFDQKLRSGLIDILRANKELFQGKAKGFNVAKALSATTIRDFDEAISMISYGFNDIDDFYSKISTGKSISSVKIPLLFIQSGDSTAPPFSVPRSSISENPFSSLLLCSGLPSTISGSERSAIRWCQHIVIEWLSAVEFALLKGRHPLLKDVDITINPSKGLTFIDGIASEKSISTRSKAHGFYKPSQLFFSHKNVNGDTMKRTQSSSINGYLIDPLARVKENDGAVQNKANRRSIPGSELHRVQRDEDIGTKQDINIGVPQQSNEVNSSLAHGEGDSPIDSEGSQVLQTAAVVMNMLDVTMPGALEDEQKKKVLTAMEQGETLMKALEGAVPLDVRGKLTTAVTEILQTRGTNLNLDVLKRIGRIPNVTSDVMSTVQEKFKGNSTRENGYDVSISEHRTRGDATEGRTRDDSVFISSANNNTQESIESSQEKAAQASGCIEAGSEDERKQSQSVNFEKAIIDGDEGTGEQYKINQSSEMSNRPSVSDEVVANDINDVQKNEGNKMDSVAEQNNPVSFSNSDEEISAVPSTNGQQVMEKEGNEIPKNDDKIIQDVVDQNLQSSGTKPEEPLPDTSSNPPSISVTQALDAVTGFDDSTQMAVTSVFGVLENMIDELEKASNQGTDEEASKIKDQDSVNVSHELPLGNQDNSEKIFDNNIMSVESDVIHTFDQTETSSHEDDSDSHGKTDGNWDGSKESKVRHSLPTSSKYSVSSSQENDRGFIHSDSAHAIKVGHVQKFPLEEAVSPCWKSPYGIYFRRYQSAQLPITNSFDLDYTTDLFLDPEEGQWIMPSQADNTRSSINERGEKQKTTPSLSRQSDEENIIEPSYVILDTVSSELEHRLNEEYDTIGYSSIDEDVKKEKLTSSIRNTLLDSLKIEVGRRLGMPDLRELDSDIVYDLEHVADAVSLAVIRDTELNFSLLSKTDGCTPIKFCTVDGEHIIRTISSALEDASHLRKVLPVGVLVGSSLASLRKYFEVAALHDSDQSKAISKPGNMQDKFYGQEGHIKTGKGQCDDSDSSREDNENTGTEILNNNGVMVGTVTAALGASVLFANHQHKKFYEHETNETPSGSYEHAKFENTMQERNQIGLVESLAGKAMSVAAPVVPTNSNGEVDQERLVAILAELGQKGGILRLVGKLALLWGGVRGALSLTDRLISFFHIADRPLFQRLLGFVCMVLLLWSPVVIPLLPALVQSWTTKTSNGMAESACIIGLYVAIMVLVMLWGKRIRGYDNPIEQYGLDFTAATRVHEFTKGLVGGMMIVLCIHSINALLGYAHFSWAPSLTSSSADAVMLLKASGSVLFQAVRGIMQATCIAIVEELVFRSWLTEEVAADLGYYRAVMISGIVFSLVQRSLPSVPGFLLLSLALYGIKQRANNKLFAPIGIRAGIMAVNFVLRTAGFLTYPSSTPFWLTSVHLWHPFDGAVGLSFCAIMAIFFYPRPVDRPLAKNTSEG